MIKSNFKLFALALILLMPVVNMLAQPVAFPSAEGYGRIATGGRGTTTDGKKIFLDAKVVAVTNLDDDGVGSFRWALTQQDTLYNGIKLKIPTTIVFKVGGVINLKSDIHSSTKNLTIAGQTAPGDGICFRGATLNFSASTNIIVRYIRSRPGDELGEETSAFRIENGGNFIIDHCSFSWAIEETTHFSSNENTTVQWCIISESLYNSIHKKGPRGYGTQWGGEYASYHHNLLADHNSRMPRINGSNENDVYALIDYRNNVNYNWGSAGAFYGGEWEATGGKGFSHVNVVNNYFKPGPATSGTTFCAPSLNRDGRTLDGYAQWFINGNIMEGNEAKTNDNWLGVDASEVGGVANIRYDTEHVKTDGVLEQYDNYTQSASESYASLLENVGVTVPKRGTHDTRLIQEIKGEIGIVRYEYTTTDGQTTPQKGVTSGLIDTQTNLVSPEDRAAGKTAWDVYVSTPASESPVDTDNDGMPDVWETAHELNPNSYTDFRTITPSGYTYLEVYLSELVGDTIDYKEPYETGVEILKETTNLNLFPNPCTNNLSVNSKVQIISIELFDLSGRKVMAVSDLNGINNIAVNELQKGCYLVKALTSSGDVLISKVVKN